VARRKICIDRIEGPGRSSNVEEACLTADKAGLETLI
jgi:hypothetical protein